MQLDRAGWLRVLGIDDADAPQFVVVECAWPRRTPGPASSPLVDARATALPGVTIGTYAETVGLHAHAYGATEAVESVHVAGELDAHTVVLLGWGTALQPGIKVGDVAVGQSATIGEGVSQYYGGHGTATAERGFAEAAEEACAAAGLTVHRGRMVTTDALLAQPPRLVESWSGAGHFALDLETSAVLSAATYFGMRAVSLLSIWSEFEDPRSVFEPPPQAQLDTYAATRDAVREIGFQLAVES